MPANNLQGAPSLSLSLSLCFFLASFLSTFAPNKAVYFQHRRQHRDPSSSSSRKARLSSAVKSRSTNTVANTPSGKIKNYPPTPNCCFPHNVLFVSASISRLPSRHKYYCLAAIRLISSTDSRDCSMTRYLLARRIDSRSPRSSGRDARTRQPRSARFVRAIKSLIIRYSLNERAVKASFTWMINRV